MTDTEEQKGKLGRLLEKFAKEPANSPEERAAFAAERAAMDGTALESAMMLENRDIAVKFTEYSQGSTGHNWYTVAPTDDGYEDCCKRHGLTKPGDTNTIVEKLIDGQWVVQASEDEKSDL